MPRLPIPSMLTPLLARVAALGRALDVACPNRCALCHGASRGRAGRLCPACLARHPGPARRCSGCGLGLAGDPAGGRCGRCLRQPPPWDRAVAALDHAPPWDAVVRAYKDAAALDLGPSLSACLARAVAGLRPAPTLLLPVPLGPARLQQRGHQQAWGLARGLGRELGLDARPDLLLRPLDGPDQRSLDRRARATAVRGAFVLAPGATAVLRGQRLLLVDDVMTTGATLAEACRVLRVAQPAGVDVAVLARRP